MAQELSIEAINAPFSIDDYRQGAEQQALVGRTLLKIGIGVMVLDPDDNMLVLHHEAREGQWPQGAAGPSMETVRYTKPKEDSTTMGPAESPMQAWQRSLHEELGMTQDDISDAGFFFSSDSIIDKGEWHLGSVNGYPNVYVGGISMVLRVNDPDSIRRALSRIGGRSEEIIKISFDPPDKAQSFTVVRPGFIQWLAEIQEVRSCIERNDKPIIYVEPVVKPMFYGDDIRFTE